MKISKSVFALLSLVWITLFAFAFIVWAELSPPVLLLTASAEDWDDWDDEEDDFGAYTYDITAFDVTMDVSKDRVVQVKESITVYFTGYNSHGIIRDLPLDSGVRYENFTAACDHSDFYYYSQTDDSSFFSVYLRGDGVVSGKTRTYTLSYTMSVPKLSEPGYLPLDVIGYGWQTDIQNVTARITLPQSPLEYKVYSGYYGTQANQYAQALADGNVITLTANHLPKGIDGNAAGITLDLRFDANLLGENFDWAILIALLIAVLLVGGATVCRALVCLPHPLTPTVNFTAPEQMDPLRMGKLIDNTVDSEDIGSLVFWFAEQGYLTIDLTFEHDPLLRKTNKPLPGNAPEYQRWMYNGLFQNANEVRVSDLKDKFYQTADKVRMGVPGIEGGVYQKKTVSMPVIFAIFTALACGLFSFIFSKRILFDYFYWGTPALACVSFITAAIGAFLSMQYEFKWKKGVRGFSKYFSLVLGGALGLLAFVIPSATFDAWNTLLLSIASSVAGCICGGGICRTKQYVDTLGQIVGFKNFILYTEKDKIKFMLEEKPELYYHILPYAQILGVSNEWTDKFKGLAASAPSYVYYHGDILDYMIWSSLFNSMTANVSATMVSRPSKSGGGINGGGFGGGFGGGGFGGGGGRGC